MGVGVGSVGVEKVGEGRVGVGRVGAEKVGEGRVGVDRMRVGKNYICLGIQSDVQSDVVHGFNKKKTIQIQSHYNNL